MKRNHLPAAGKAVLKIAVWAILAGSAAAQSSASSENDLKIAPVIADFSPEGFWAREQALRHSVLMLACDQMEGRLTGSAQDSLSALYIGKEFMQNGLVSFSTAYKTARPGTSQTDYWQPYTFKARWGEQVRSRNVVGVVPGTDSLLSDRFIVVGAHFDHLGWGDKVETSMRKGVHEIHNGADDNASGVAVMLELMRYYSEFPLRKTLVFVAFSGEEIGLCGSNAFLDGFPFETGRIDAMFNLDMLGGLHGDEFRINGSGTSSEAAQMIKNAARNTELKLSSSPDGHGPSDHAVFYARQIPVFFFCTSPTATYHTPDDDPSTLDYAGMVKAAGVIGDLLAQVGNGPALHFVSTGTPRGSMMGMGKFKVTLGLMPDINNTARRGLTAMIVVEGKPAYRAGLRSGDVILRIDGRKINSTEAYMEALSALEPGSSVKIEAVRKADGKRFVCRAEV